MPYELYNTCLQDDMYGYSKLTEDKDVVSRDSMGYHRQFSDEAKQQLKRRHDEILSGKGLDTPKYEPYRPLGSMKTVFQLKIGRGTAKKWPLNSVCMTPEPEAERPPTPPTVPRTLGVPPRRIGAGYTPGYSAIQGKILESNDRVKVVRAGRPMADFITEQSSVDRMKWAGSHAIPERTGESSQTPASNRFSIQSIINKIDSKTARELSQIQQQNSYILSQASASNLPLDLAPSTRTSPPHTRVVSPEHPSTQRRKQSPDPSGHVPVPPVIESSPLRVGSAAATASSVVLPPLALPQLCSQAQYPMPASGSLAPQKSSANYLSRTRHLRPHFLPFYALRPTLPVSHSPVEPFTSRDKESPKELPEGTSPKSSRPPTPYRWFTAASTRSALDPVHQLRNACQSFLSVREKGARQLYTQLDRFEFYRTEFIQNKFKSFEVNVGGSEEGRTMLDTDLQRMRLSAEQISLEHRIENIRKCKWFLRLLEKSQQFKTFLEPSVKKFIVSIQQVIEDGHEFTEDLFYEIHLNILTFEDHKCADLEKLTEFVRKDVLALDIRSYFSFLKRHDFPIPPSLMVDLQALSYLEQSRKLSAV